LHLQIVVNVTQQGETNSPIELDRDLWNLRELNTRYPYLIELLESGHPKIGCSAPAP